MIIEFMVPGNPVAKGRVKFARRGKYVATYSPAKTVSYEGLVALSAKQAMRGIELIMGAVSVDLDIRLQIPVSWSKKKKAAAVEGLVAAIGKPDIDNLEKSLFDGMNGVVWKDDSQAVDVKKRKRYAETPGVIVTVRELEVIVS